ncbi:MAG TPA: VOC family protein, partial [Acidimicrobiales bacterium]|nr:VOC family protein [Acidimicrobiales bacterium]
MDAAFKDVGAVILFVEDLERSKGFYNGTLGLPVQFEDDQSIGFGVEGLFFIVLQVDRARDQLQGEATATPRDGATAFMTTFTGDADGLHAELVARGVTFFQPPTDQPWGMRTAYFKDPDGHV